MQYMWVDYRKDTQMIDKQIEFDDDRIWEWRGENGKGIYFRCKLMLKLRNSIIKLTVFHIRGAESNFCRVI